LSSAAQRFSSHLARAIPPCTTRSTTCVMRWRSFLATESVSFGIVLLSIHAALLSSGLGAEALSVHFKSSPPAELLRPFADPIDFSLLITRADGRPVEEGRVAIRVEAPRPGRFFSTDYPLVEGTLLAQMELPIRAGRAQWKQLLPIRGDYRLTARVSGNELQATETFAVHVREHRHKWFAVAGLSVALFALGFVAGRIFTCLPPTVIAISLAAASLPSLPRLADSAMLEIGAASIGWPAGRDACGDSRNSGSGQRAARGGRRSGTAVKREPAGPMLLYRFDRRGDRCGAVEQVHAAKRCWSESAPALSGWRGFGIKKGAFACGARPFDVLRRKVSLRRRRAGRRRDRKTGTGRNSRWRAVFAALRVRDSSRDGRRPTDSRS
jgi:hypothetical protein